MRAPGVVTALTEGQGQVLHSCLASHYDTVCLYIYIHKYIYAVRLFPPNLLRVRQSGCSLRELQANASVAPHPSVLCFQHVAWAALSTRQLISSLPFFHHSASQSSANLTGSSLHSSEWSFCSAPQLEQDKMPKTSSTIPGIWLGVPQANFFTFNTQQHVLKSQVFCSSVPRGGSQQSGKSEMPR